MIVNIENVHKSFGDLEVLRGVSFSINEAELVAIVGPSGAGKTTLLQLIGSLDSPNSGDIYIRGQQLGSLKGNKLAAFRNKHIGFIFQFHQLLPEFTALENVQIPAMIAQDKHYKDKALELLDYLGLKDRIHHKPSQLSGGENQRVAVARALINRPSIILADEPSGSLDSQNKIELHALLQDMQKQFNQTIVVITHDQALADSCNRKIQLKDGLIVP